MAILKVTVSESGNSLSYHVFNNMISLPDRCEIYFKSYVDFNESKASQGGGSVTLVCLPIYDVPSLSVGSIERLCVGSSYSVFHGGLVVSNSLELPELKSAQWTKIKQARSQAEYAGFTWDGAIFDSDAISQNRITGAVALAQMSSTFSIGWVLADNSVRTLSQSNMLQVGAALGAHVAAQFAKGVLLREAIEAATSQAEIEAVVW